MKQQDGKGVNSMTKRPEPDKRVPKVRRRGRRQGGTMIRVATETEPPKR